MTMKRLLTILLSLALLDTSAADAAAPRTLGYQGVLIDSQGVLVADGTYSMNFRIYALPSGGTALWSEAQEVALADGRFDVILGSVTPLTITFDAPYWLALQVGSDPEMSPRIELAGSPYSHMARSVEDGAVTSTKIADGTAVRQLNGLSDSVDIVGEGDVSVTTVRDQIRISTSGGHTPPGVASAKGITSGSLTGPGTVDVLASRTISCPSAGYVLVIASGHVFLNHANGNPTYARVGTSDSSTSFPSNQQITAQVPFNVASGTFTFPLTSHGLYEVSAGSSTFYLLGEKGGNGSASVGDVQLSLVYIDTSYGTVSPTLVGDDALGRSASDPPRSSQTRVVK